MTEIECATADDVAVEAASHIVAVLRAALARNERALMAVSGGTTPGRAFERLKPADLDWDRVDIFQVDERVAPEGDPARNLAGLRTSLLSRVPARAYPMPVGEADLDAAASAYARSLPPAFDLIQLGLGADGHTASLIPGDAVLAASSDVAMTAGPYQGTRRMTLTAGPINRARSILWIVTGAEKRAALAALRAGRDDIPANRIARDHAVIIADRAALG